MRALIAMVLLVGCVDSRPTQPDPTCDGTPGSFVVDCGGWVPQCVQGDYYLVCDEAGCSLADQSPSGWAGVATCDQATGAIACDDGRLPICFDLAGALADGDAGTP